MTRRGQRRRHALGGSTALAAVDLATAVVLRHPAQASTRQRFELRRAAATPNAIRWRRGRSATPLLLTISLAALPAALPAVLLPLRRMRPSGPVSIVRLGLVPPLALGVAPRLALGAGSISVDSGE